VKIDSRDAQQFYERKQIVQLDAMSRTVALWILAAFFVVAGANHFLNPGPYFPMMPPYLPWPEGLIIVSGIAEIGGRLGLLVPRVRRLAGWGLIALLVAVFPANVQVALHGWPGEPIPHWALWARLPLQGVLIAWVYWICLVARSQSDPRKLSPE
jgi:uncharacterized membrane protein